MRKIKKGFTPKSRACRGGFTLIELLVAVTIVLVISSVALVSYQSANKRARDDKRKSDLEMIRAALEMYRLDNDVYPLTLSLLVADYIAVEPDDPKDDYGYYYNRSTLTTYDLCACFEQSGYSDSCLGSCGTETCNYKLTNP